MAAEETTEGVRITNREIYNALMDVKEALAPLPAKVTDHENRIRSLERLVWGAGGIGGIAGSLVTLLVASWAKN